MAADTSLPEIREKKGKKGSERKRKSSSRHPQFVCQKRSPSESYPLFGGKKGRGGGGGRGRGRILFKSRFPPTLVVSIFRSTQKKKKERQRAELSGEISVYRTVEGELDSAASLFYLAHKEEFLLLSYSRKGRRLQILFIIIFYPILLMVPKGGKREEIAQS